MKYLSIVLLIAGSIALSSCEFPSKDTETIEQSGQVEQKTIAEAGDTVAVNYVGTLEDGEVFDTSRQEVAEEAGIYSAGRPYEPLEFTVAAGQMIPGFDQAVEGMKVGETKTITIAPEDAYGAEYSEITIPREQFEQQQSFEQSATIGQLQGDSTDSFPLALASQVFGEGEITIGATQEANGAIAEIVAIDEENVTIKITDPNAPFSGQEIISGTTTTIEEDGTILEILSVDEEGNATVKIMPKYEIISETDEEVTIKQKNNHELAGKSLTFEIELVSVTAGIPQAPSLSIDELPPVSEIIDEIITDEDTITSVE